ncbi:13542_t:CDS:1 [Funneliformis geosporum]|uniref:13542_t:CDS:1 n=1 Tax=Funneliformis geosporum TaxID=1117311 RepID=A0A9W4WHJ0_9GLOM|nr:13542_t:CDS:1 [Funneliformis geosporum]
MVNIKNNRKETREETIKRLSDPNYQGGNYALPENASESEKIKYEICQNIAKYKRINEIYLKDLAYELGISQTKLDNILYCRINLLKLDELANCLEKLQIPFHLEIAGNTKRA